MKIINPLDFCKKIINKIDKNDKIIILTTFIIGILNNLYFIVGEGVAPDAVSPAFFNVAGNWEITLGRFGIKYINKLRYGFVSQLVIILICLTFIALSVMVLKRIFKLKNPITILILTMMITLAPQFMETYMFIYCADAYLVAFFLAILANYFIFKSSDSKLYYIGTIICTIIVCSLYQAYLGVELGILIIIGLNDLIINNTKIKEILKKLIISLFIILIGVVSYYLILKLLLLALGLQLASYKGANGLGINTILKMPKSILQCYKDFYHFFFKNTIIFNAWWHRKRLYAVIFVSLFVGILYYLIKNDKLKKAISKLLFASLLLLIYPLCINVMNIIASGTIINLVTGPGIITSVIIPIIFLEKMPNNSIHNLLKWLVAGSMVVLIWTFFLSNVFTYIVREETYINYKTVATDIYTKATMLEEYSEDKEWMFSDIIRFSVRDVERSNGFIARDNATWKNYNGTLQNRGLFEKNVGIKITMVDRKTYDKIKETEEFINMPIYPNPGSIRIIEDAIVVKTSEKVY